jgi:hypothetical protein
MALSSMMQHASRSDLAHLALNNALRYNLDTDRAMIQVSFHSNLLSTSNPL